MKKTQNLNERLHALEQADHIVKQDKEFYHLWHCAKCETHFSVQGYGILVYEEWGSRQRFRRWDSETCAEMLIKDIIT